MKMFTAYVLYASWMSSTKMGVTWTPDSSKYQFTGSDMSIFRISLAMYLCFPFW